jgi:hypothetical protein
MILCVSGSLAAEPDEGSGSLEVTPAGGLLGEQPYFALRGAYTISRRIAVEAEVGHNVGDLVSAYVHSAGIRVTGIRYRGHAIFTTLGFGTFSAGSSDVIAAQSVTRSHLRLGGGMRLRLRDDVGVRLDLRHHRVFLNGGTANSGQSIGVNEVSLGLAFTRRVWSPPQSSTR